MKNSENRVFSIELDSKKNLKNITIENGSSNKVTIEGTIGVLVEARYEEDVILQVVGTEGVLRIDLSPSDIKEEEE